MRLRPGGHTTPVSPLLAAALAAALHAAETTGGLVDPTVGAAVSALGYDRDFAWSTESHPAPGRTPGTRTVGDRVRPEHAAPPASPLARSSIWVRAGRRLPPTEPPPGWSRRCRLRRAGLAWWRRRRRPGAAPEGGWAIGIADDHRGAVTRASSQTIAIDRGGIATSSTTTRAWRWRRLRTATTSWIPARGRSAEVGVAYRQRRGRFVRGRQHRQHGSDCRRSR